MNLPSRTPIPTEFLDEGAKDKITAPQESFLRSLLASRVFPDHADGRKGEERAARTLAALDAGEVDKKLASKLISLLKEQPWKPKTLPARGGETRDITGERRARVEYEDITTDRGTRRVGKLTLPDGRTLLAGSYGIDTKGDDRFTNDTSFFKLWIGDRGGWSLQLYVSDDTNRVKLAFPTQLAVIAKILDAGPAEASALFGHEFGRCGVCGRGLTNDVSRTFGIGPVCRARLAL
jgi:hypothetical protein